MTVSRKRITAGAAAAFMLLNVLMSGQYAGEGTAGIGDGLMFYASFDDSLAPTNCAGSRWAGGVYVGEPGQAGRAFGSRGDGASYVSRDNLAPAAGSQQGTVSFWVRPARPLNEVRGAIFHASWMRLVSDPARSKVYFQTEGSGPGEAFAWDSSAAVTAASVPTGRWTHVVLTWDCAKGRKTIYLNGKAADSGRVRKTFRTTAGPSDAFGLGFGAPAAHDELMVWRRLLTAEEIKRLHRDASAVAGELRALPVSAAAAPAVEAGLVEGHAYEKALVAPGEPFAFQVPVVSRANTPHAGTVRLRLLNLWQDQVGEPIVTNFSLPTGGVQKIAASFTAARTGVYKVEAVLASGGRETLRDVVSFGCVPAEIPPRHPFFGAHIDDGGGMARRLGFTGNRVHNMTQFTWWHQMQPERGQWKMNGAAVYSHLNALGFEHLGQWMGTAHWAVTQPDGKNPSPHGYAGPWVPTDMDAFREYIRESIVRFPAIKEWEFWNEPTVSQFWLGSAEDYVRCLKVAYVTAKATRPDVTIYAQCYISPFFRDALKAGLLDGCDGITYHWYGGAGEDWDAQRLYIREVKEMVKPYLKKPLLIRNSEGGLGGSTFLRNTEPSPMNYVAASERMVQFCVTAMAEGVKAWDYYMFGLNPVGYSSLECGLGWPRPMTVATCILAWQLNGGTFASEKELAGGALRAYLFERPGGESLGVLWTVENAIVDLRIKGVCLDLMGGEIAMPAGKVRVTPSPIYLRKPGTVAGLASELDKAKIELVEAPVSRIKIEYGKTPTQKMGDYPIASELGEARLIPLDLKAVANMALKDESGGDWKGGAFDEGAYNDMRDLPAGRHKWLGVPFEIPEPEKNGGRCIVTLAGKTFSAGPTQVGPIPVNRKVRGLFFAHAANWAIEKGLVVGGYRVNYEDGKQTALPIVVGTNIYNWWHDHQKDEESRTVWFECPDSLDQGAKDRFIRIWYWENPRADVPVKSLEITSEKKDPCIAVLGITQAVW